MRKQLDSPTTGGAAVFAPVRRRYGVYDHEPNWADLPRALLCTTVLDQRWQLAQDSTELVGVLCL
eukprot:COSAG05_NODE_10983_length_536_cov_0.940503_1_plen_64_part_01